VNGSGDCHLMPYFPLDFPDPHMQPTAEMNFMRIPLKPEEVSNLLLCIPVYLFFHHQAAPFLTLTPFLSRLLVYSHCKCCEVKLRYDH